MLNTTAPDRSYEILSDGKMVWVNGKDGALIGRFGVNGIDIHQGITEQGTNGECLYCTRVPTTMFDWDDFVEKMNYFYNIVVPTEHRPTRFLDRGNPPKHHEIKKYFTYNNFNMEPEDDSVTIFEDCVLVREFGGFPLGTQIGAIHLDSIYMTMTLKFLDEDSELLSEHILSFNYDLQPVRPVANHGANQ